MEDVFVFDVQCQTLCNNKGFKPQNNVAHARFIQDFVAHSWLSHSKNSQGFNMLTMLNDSSNLFDSTIFNTNFRTNLKDMVKENLKNNQTFCDVLNVLISNKSKGVGIGEMILPLLVDSWQLVNGFDGWCAGGSRECKNGMGSSLKPIPAGTTDHGHIDRLNESYWNSTFPGLKKTHAVHASLVTSMPDHDKKYQEYLEKIYPGYDVSSLAAALVKNIQDLEEYNWILGTTVLTWYKNLDKWQSIVLIHPETLDIVNIANIDDSIRDLGIRFLPVMQRGKNTQAVSDGFVNIEMCKNVK